MNTDFNIKNYDELTKREKLQNLFDASFAKADEILLRKHYQSLRHLELKSNISFIPEAFDVSFLVETLTNVCDIFCSDYNKNFIFCGNDICTINGNQRFVIKAILNLLSNAFIYGRGNLITTKTFSRDRIVHIEIQSGGSLSPEFQFKNGLSFVKKVCEYHNGHFFIETSKLYTNAILLLPESRVYLENAHNLNIFDFLTDRLSPFYIEFFGQN